MLVVVHEAKGVNLPSSFLAGLLQGREEMPAIIVVAENGFFVIAAIHDVVNCARILHSYLSSHRSSRISDAADMRQYEKMTLLSYLIDSVEKALLIKNEQLKTPPKQSSHSKKIAYGAF